MFGMKRINVENLLNIYYVINVMAYKSFYTFVTCRKILSKINVKINTMSETKVVAISNFKGGVGKTTSCANIGAALAEMGKKVLLIDLDPQFNLTRCFGIKAEQNIYGALRGDYPMPIIERLPLLHIVPSALELIKAETEFVSEYKREEKLNNILKSLPPQYDFILIDCPPSLGVLAQIAFTSADLIFVPIQSEYLALTGYSVLSEALDRIGLEIDAVFITQYDQRQILDRTILEKIKEMVGEKLLNAIIRQNVAVAESTTTGQSVLEYAPTSKGSIDYRALAKEILVKFS
jgi:chromosome partitioning protein